MNNKPIFIYVVVSEVYKSPEQLLPSIRFWSVDDEDDITESSEKFTESTFFHNSSDAQDLLFKAKEQNPALAGCMKVVEFKVERV